MQSTGVTLFVFAMFFPSSLQVHAHRTREAKEHRKQDLKSGEDLVARSAAVQVEVIGSLHSPFHHDVHSPFHHDGHVPFHHDGHVPAILVGVMLLILVLCVCTPIVGYFRARGLLRRLEAFKFQHPVTTSRRPASELPDGMARLAQECRIYIRQKVNALQEVSGLAGFSIQTANQFEVVAGGASEGRPEEMLMLCKEQEDLESLAMRNLVFRDRSESPFQICITLPGTEEPQVSQPLQTMMVVVPPEVQAGQTVQVATPAGQQIMVAVPEGAVPGSQFQMQVPAALSRPSVDTPFLYLDRTMTCECCCFCRPHVQVFDLRGGKQTLLGIITDPFACCDMTFRIHVGADATPESPVDLCVRGPACQVGAVCTCCGLCCGKTCQEVYLEVIDPKIEKTVAAITKGWAGAKELLTAANHFHIDFGEVVAPEYKAMLLATTIFVNYRFFEQIAGRTSER